jgi:hypothetical protein
MPLGDEFRSLTTKARANSFNKNNSSNSDRL